MSYFHQFLSHGWPFFLCEEEKKYTKTQQNREKSNIISIHIIFALGVLCGQQLGIAAVSTGQTWQRTVIASTSLYSGQLRCPENDRKGHRCICRKAQIFLALSSAHQTMSPQGEVQRKGEGHFRRVQLVLKKSQFSECWHFNDRNKQFEFVLQQE